ncbi:hypothetical protein [Streptomyces sp. x-80]|uniref:hypothetical protein n=1 Tax=Streptomyces sp. x-80 TaxID=2789282 RepID=UPI00397F91ED
MIERLYGRAKDVLNSVGTRFGMTALRVSVGAVFIWFGWPKLVPGLSPAEPLVLKTVEKLTLGVVEGNAARALTGGLEVVIGLLLISGRLLVPIVLVLFGHMAGTFAPLVLFPGETWKSLGVGTLEGQYILKNVVLISAALALVGHRVQRSRQPYVAVEKLG